MELYKIIVIAAGFFSGITFLTVSITGFRRDNYIKTQGIPAQAEVVDIKRNGSDYKPVVEYYTSRGKIRAKSVYSGSGIFFGCKVGDRVNIFSGIMALIMTCFIPFILP